MTETPRRVTREQRSRALPLVEAALTHSLNPDTKTSTLLNCAIRVARLIDDYNSLAWLEMEAEHYESKYDRWDASLEVRLYLGEENAKRLLHYANEAFIEERNCTTGLEFDPEGDPGEQRTLTGLSVAEIEAHRAYAVGGLADLYQFPQSEFAPIDDSFQTACKVRKDILRFDQLLARIRARVVRYLTREERLLLFGDVMDEVFDGYRAEADARLEALCPEALAESAVAFKRLNEGDPSSLKHAALSCRSLFELVADAVYPARDEEVLGWDGKSHPMKRNQYANRLAQAVYENREDNTRDSVIAALQDLDNRLRELVKTVNDSIHSQPSVREIRYCIVQTYVLLAEVLSATDSPSVPTAQTEGGISE